MQVETWIRMWVIFLTFSQEHGQEKMSAEKVKYQNNQEDRKINGSK